MYVTKGNNGGRRPGAMNSTIRGFLRSILPPIVVDAAGRVRRRFSTSEWEAVSDTDEIWAPRISEGWNHQSIVDTQLQKWQQFVESLKAPRPFDRFWQGEIFTVGYVLGRAAGNRKHLAILDWGGGLGRHFVYARELHPEIAFAYTIKDMPGLCTAGQSLLPEVSFVADDDKALGGTYDFVLAASSLQFARNLYELLDRLCNTGNQWFMVLRTPFVERCDDFVVVQRPRAHGYLTEYSGWFINRQKFIGCIESKGFSLEREFPAGFDIFVPNAPEQCSVTGFLFKRKH